MKKVRSRESSLYFNVGLDMCEITVIVDSSGLKTHVRVAVGDMTYVFAAADFIKFVEERGQ